MRRRARVSPRDAAWELTAWALAWAVRRAVELRGGAGASQKVNTNSCKVKDEKIVLNATVELSVNDGNEELRILVCKKKAGAGNVATVIAAAGIFVRDIIKMSGSIVKDFDLFKPGGKGDLGGVIKLEMKYISGWEDAAAPESTAVASSSKGTVKVGGGFLVKALAVAAVAGVGALLASKKQKKKK